MKTLKESLLDSTRNKVTSGKETISKMRLFGNLFKLKYVNNLSKRTAQCISARGIKSLTNGMDYMDPMVERGIFDPQGKVKRLCNYIEHIDLAEWGFVGVDWERDSNKRMEFGVKLCEELTKAGAFNGGGRCWINAYSYSSMDFVLMFSDFDVKGIPTFSIEFELI